VSTITHSFADDEGLIYLLYPLFFIILILHAEVILVRLSFLFFRCVFLSIACIRPSKKGPSVVADP